MYFQLVKIKTEMILGRFLGRRFDALRALICCRRVRLAKTNSSQFVVAYAHKKFPAAVPDGSAIISGGAVKYRYLSDEMPHSGTTCNILYAVSSSHLPGMARLLEAAQNKGIRVVWNQNGAWFPSAYGHNVAAKGNAQMAPLLHAADYVFYQSQFAKLASDHFLGERKGPSEILYNAVDTDLFACLVRPLQNELVLLAAGSHNDTYRLPLAFETLSHVLKKKRHARLLIAGRLTEAMQEKINSMAAAMKLSNFIEVTGSYSQAEAPRIFSRAHILLHTQYNDVCPTVVIEAMACGLPVVYSSTGGTPELVGVDAGYGVPGELDWNTPRPPSAEEMAEGVCVVAERLRSYSSAARERAVEYFDLKHWLQRHREIFEKLAG